MDTNITVTYRGVSQEEGRQIARWFDMGQPPKDIAAHFGRHVRTIREIAYRFGATSKGSGARPVIGPSGLKEVIRRYQAGETCAAIGESFGVSPKTVSAALKRAGIQMRKNARPLVIPDTRLPEVSERYLSGKSAEDIALDYGCSATTIRVALRKAGVPRRPNGPIPASPPLVQVAPTKEGQ